MLKFSPWYLLFAPFMVALACLCPTALAQSTPAAKPSSGNNLSAAVGLNELKIEMAQTRFKLSKNPKAINDLVNALEEYLSANCMGKLLQTLTYNGNPTDPTCVARVDTLLEVNPKNPVALCVRDGISAKSCVEAYQNQTIEPVYEGSTDEDIDPALRIGLSAATAEKIEKIEDSLKQVDTKYQEAPTPEEKRAFINDAANLYDQALGMACRVSAVSIKPSGSSGDMTESTELAQTRERLLQIPVAIRKDYQVEMERKVQDEMSKTSTSDARKEELRDLLKIIHDPSAPSQRQLSNMTRTRLILDKCNQLIRLAGQIVPELPAITCYREGWYTPQCVASLKKWRAIKQQEMAIAKGTPASKVSTPSMISKF